MNAVTLRTRIALFWFPAIAYMALIWIMSSIETPISVADVPFQDKGVHAAEYAGLSALLLHALLGTFTAIQPLTLAFGAMSGATIWGLIDEIHQAYVPGRVSDIRDLMADAIGAALGVTLYYAVTRIRRAPRT